MASVGIVGAVVAAGCFRPRIMRRRVVTGQASTARMAPPAMAKRPSRAGSNCRPAAGSTYAIMTAPDVGRSLRCLISFPMVYETNDERIMNDEGNTSKRLGPSRFTPSTPVPVFTLGPDLVFGIGRSAYLV